MPALFTRMSHGPKDIARSETLCGVFGRGDACGIGDVALQRQRPGTGRSKQVSGGAAIFGVVVEQHDRHSSLRHPERHRSADAAAGPGYHADSALEPEPVATLLRHTRVSSDLGAG
jgi:hypothetical protein